MRFRLCGIDHPNRALRIYVRSSVRQHSITLRWKHQVLIMLTMKMLTLYLTYIYIYIYNYHVHCIMFKFMFRVLIFAIISIDHKEGAEYVISFKDVWSCTKVWDEIIFDLMVAVDGITKVVTIHPEGGVHVCTKFNANSLQQCPRLCPVEALCLKCPINAVVKVTDLEITPPCFNARLHQCLLYVFLWSGKVSRQLQTVHL